MDRRQEIIHALEQGLVQTVAFFESLSPDQLNREIYQDGCQWTALQVVAHFISIEGSMHWLFNNILSGGQGSPKDFDVERFNRSQTRKMDGLTLGKLLVRFKKVRRESIRIVASMSEADLDRKGHHAFHGRDRLERFIRWAYEHAQMHEAEVRQVLNNHK